MCQAQCEIPGVGASQGNERRYPCWPQTDGLRRFQRGARKSIEWTSPQAGTSVGLHVNECGLSIEVSHPRAWPQYSRRVLEEDPRNLLAHH